MKINAIDNTLSLDKIRMNKLSVKEGPVSEPSPEEANEEPMDGLELIGRNNIAFQGLNKNVMKKGLQIGAVAMMAMFATSCVDRDAEDTIVNVETNVSVTVDVSEVVAELRAMNADLKAAIQHLEEKYDMRTSEMMGILIQYGIKADQILAYLAENSNKSDAIIDGITGLGKDNQELKALLQDVIQLGKDQNVLIGGGNDLLTQIIAMIYDLGQQNHQDNTQVIALLKSTLGQLSKMDAHQKTAFSKLLSAINKNTDAVNNNTAADKENTKKIIDEVNKVGIKVLNKLDKLDNKSAIIIDYLAEVVENQEILGEKADILINSADVIIENQEKLGDKVDTLIDVNLYIAKNVDRLGNKADKLININTNIAQNVEKLGKKADTMIRINTGIAKDVSKLGKSADVVIDLLENLVELEENRPAGGSVDIQPVLDMMEEIINKMGSMTAAQQSRFEKLLDAINKNTAAVNNNTAGDVVNTQKILDAINGAAGIADLILDNVRALGGKADTMIDLLTKLVNKPNASSGDINLDDLKDFLRDLISTVNVNNNINTQAIIDAINAKQTGCTCDHSELLAKIEVIINHMTDGKTGNEGIVEDLDKLFG